MFEIDGVFVVVLACIVRDCAVVGVQDINADGAIRTIIIKNMVAV